MTVQLLIAMVTGLLFANPYGLTSSGQCVRLGIVITLLSFAAAYTSAGTANDLHNGLIVALSYALEAGAIACIIASVVLFDGSGGDPLSAQDEAGSEVRISRVTLALRLSLIHI